MELRQLRYLVALAEELNFTRAAAREHVAQPALSQQIRRLEEEVGLPLVERTTRQVALTEAGGVLVARARRVLAELDAAGTELQALRGMDTGHVTIGAMHTMGPVDLSLPLALFHDRHPGVGLSGIRFTCAPSRCAMGASLPACSSASFTSAIIAHSIEGRRWVRSRQAAMASSSRASG